ncbi:hypothetical protein DQM22_13735 [Lactiplantibacillus plantarum]|nr:hypothetical protein DQM22_13735 [Lactiplantibacillus plantarum]
MRIVGKLYCIDGNTYSPRDQTGYVVGFNEIDEDSVRTACRAYIDDYFGRMEFEADRGISLEELTESADLVVTYERFIPISESNGAYDIWGEGMYTLGNKPGRGARKVWTLTFTDDPLGLETGE